MNLAKVQTQCACKSTDCQKGYEDESRLSWQQDHIGSPNSPNQQSKWGLCLGAQRTCHSRHRWRSKESQLRIFKDDETVASRARKQV